MGSGVNIWVFLLGLAAFTGWTLSRFTVSRLVVWAHVVSGLGILAPSLSTVSLDNDGFQQELIRPSAPSVRLSARTETVLRQGPALEQQLGELTRGYDQSKANYCELLS